MTDTTQFIYILRVKRVEMLTDGPTPEEQAAVEAHFEYLTDLAERGEVLLFGRTQDTTIKTLGLVILRARGREAAQGLMAEDPAVSGGVMSAELFPFLVGGIAEPAAFG